ncbi:MAG: alpha/beta fold hydrolase [Actinomycetota bacterium]|jgi:pimeloyl-ACP methyl ester carboxylesterase|nr:lysophospholipase [Actinomycetota bacterium]MCL6094061.1 lysophospholipase [Actinomycetota bacterium]MDA8167857.1 alpha/beta fold hydrolase [Actinomycetota bacterium]
MSLQKFTLITNDDFRLSLVLEKLSSECSGHVVLAHGITSDKNEDGFYTRLSQYLAENMYMVSRFDFRGHGESSGNSKDFNVNGQIEDFSTVLDWASDSYQLPIAIIAASFGAPAAINTTIDHESIIHALVLLNPVLDFNRTFVNPEVPWLKGKFSSDILISALNNNGIELTPDFTLGKKLIRELLELRPYEKLTRIKCPVLSIHGDHDEYVPYEVTAQYYKANEKSRLLTIEGANHGFGIENEQIVFTSCKEWLDQNLINAN